MTKTLYVAAAFALFVYLKNRSDKTKTGCKCGH